jgi:hypothetical protein
MSDPLLLVIPLVLLGLVTLLVFVGCQVVFPVEEDEETESVDTTHGHGPGELIAIDMEISGNCDAAANAIAVTLTTDITGEQFPITLTSISPAGQTVSTTDLNITLEDEGHVVCVIEITPAEGEIPPPLEKTHDKVKGELVEPFTLSCQNGFELT